MLGCVLACTWYIFSTKQRKNKALYLSSDPSDTSEVWDGSSYLGNEYGNRPQKETKQICVASCSCSNLRSREWFEGMRSLEKKWFGSLASQFHQPWAFMLHLSIQSNRLDIWLWHRMIDPKISGLEMVWKLNNITNCCSLFATLSPHPQSPFGNQVTSVQRCCPRRKQHKLPRRGRHRCCLTSSSTEIPRWPFPPTLF